MTAIPMIHPIQQHKERNANSIFCFTTRNGTITVSTNGIKQNADLPKATPAFVDMSIKSASDYSRSQNPNHIGVPTAPQHVTNALNKNSVTTDSNGGLHVDTNIGPANATGVPKPDAPSITVAKQNNSINSAIGCPAVNALSSRIIYCRHNVASIVSNNVIAPAIIVIGVNASWNPKTTASTCLYTGSCKYANFIHHNITAAIGKLNVVGKDLCLNVA
jgi:hypothetical protein